MLKSDFLAFCFLNQLYIPNTAFVQKMFFQSLFHYFMHSVFMCVNKYMCMCPLLYRIGHDNFELVNHDIVNPLMIEGK